MMRRVPVAERALRLASDRSKTPYVCRSCLAKAQPRTLHTSARLYVEEKPAWKRWQESLFGSKESRESTRRLEAAREAKIERVVAGEDSQGEPVEYGGKVYQKAAFIVPAINKDYVPATTWENLDRIGSAEWVSKQADPGKRYDGCVNDD